MTFCKRESAALDNARVELTLEHQRLAVVRVTSIALYDDVTSQFQAAGRGQAPTRLALTTRTDRYIGYRLLLID